jgi:hypothetical protein
MASPASEIIAERVAKDPEYIYPFSEITWTAEELDCLLLSEIRKCEWLGLDEWEWKPKYSESRMARRTVSSLASQAENAGAVDMRRPTLIIWDESYYHDGLCASSDDSYDSTDSDSDSDHRSFKEQVRRVDTPYPVLHDKDEDENENENENEDEEHVVDQGDWHETYYYEELCVSSKDSDDEYKDSGSERGVSAS